MIATFRIALSLLDARSRLGVGLLFWAMILSALLEMLSIAVVVPFVRLLFMPEGGGGWMEQTRQALEIEPDSFVAMAVAGFVLLFAAKNAAYLGLNYAVLRFSMTRLARFQTALYAHYLRRPFLEKAGQHSAEIIRNTTEGAYAVFDVLRAGLNCAMEAMVLVGIAVTMAAMFPALTLSVAAILGLLGLLYTAILKPRASRWGDESMACHGQIGRWLVQGLAALKEIHVTGSAGYFEDQFSRHVHTLHHLRLLRQFTAQLPRTVIEMAVVSFGLAGLAAFHLGGGSTAELMAGAGAAALATLRAIPSLSRLLGLVGEIHQAGPFAEGLRREVGGRLDAAPPSPPVPAAAAGHAGRIARIDLDDVSFAFPDGGRPALSAVSLAIRRGESIGFVGPSGAGKSTLVNLLIGLYRPTGGRVLVDGRDIASDISSWRAMVGYVPQAITLIDASIRANVAFGVPEERIDDAAVDKALRLACLDEWVAALPEGTRTVIGENGARMSGGQRQRLGIARALYRDPEVIVFDEATSALDGKTERDVVEAINALAHQRTLVVIAHRLSTIRGCDRIYLLREGKVADIGTLAELEERNPELAQAATE